MSAKKSSRQNRRRVWRDLTRVAGYLVAVCALVLMSAGMLEQLDLPAAMVAGSFSDDPDLSRLTLAIERRDAITVSDLLHKSGLDLNRHDNDGLNPFLRAARNGWVLGCRLLLAHGVDVNVADNRGHTAMYYSTLVAGDAGNELMRLLIEHHTDLNAPDASGQTPLMMAAEYDRPDLVRLLVDAGADVNKAARNGWTALHWASFGGHAHAIQLLLAAGAFPDAEDDAGQTPADVASAIQEQFLNDRAGR